jgi:two-component sensor histidine kinase
VSASDATERKRAEERHRVLADELDHRLENALATVSSVVSQTAVENRLVANFVAALDGRIRSMATTHELLSSGRWQRIPLVELVQRELALMPRPKTRPGAGPGHLAFHPKLPVAWVLNELDSTTATYRWEKDGTLTPTQVVTTLPPSSPIQHRRRNRRHTRWPLRIQFQSRP